VAQEQVHTANHDVNIIERELASDISQMSLAIDEIELEVKSLRMLPLGTITAPFARMVRDIALEHGKEVIFQINGADTEMDKHILEQITLSAEQMGGNVIIKVSDDGSGINMDRLRRAAAQARG
jgi:two-component system chemotaxis sensor kinase CheA